MMRSWVLGLSVSLPKAHRKALANGYNSGVFIIAATSTFVRFTRFTFGKDYLAYLDAATKSAQQEIIKNKTKDACAYVENSNWFNLQTKEGRKAAMCHILALLRWQEVNDGPEEAESDFGEEAANSDSE